MSQQVTPDFSEEIIPPKPGSYRARVVTAKQEIGRTHGTPLVNWKLEVLGDRRTFTNYYSTPLSGKGAGMFRKMMEAIDPGYAGGVVDLDALAGQTLQVEMEYEKDRDGNRGRYLRVRDPLPDTDSAPFPGDEPSRGDSNSSGPSFTEDDIPF